MIGAYDPETGAIAVAGSNNKVSAEILDPRTVSFVEGKLGVKVGGVTSFCTNKVGGCAEVFAADQLIRNGVPPENIRFTPAYRSRDILGGKRHQNLLLGLVRIAKPHGRRINR